MQRVRSVREEHEPKKNPPAATGGLINYVAETGLGKASEQIANAFCLTLQARSVVNEVVLTEPEIWKSIRDQKRPFDPADRRHYWNHYNDGWSVYMGCFPCSVRNGFEKLFGHSFEAFESAMTLLAEVLFETQEPSRDMPPLLTPEAVR